MKLKEKFMSRKFWLAVISVVTGIMGMLCLDESVVSIVSTGLMTMVPTIIYIITEGKIDAASVAVTAGAIRAAAESLGNEKGKSA